jgi:hypothetical protein
MTERVRTGVYGRIVEVLTPGDVGNFVVGPPSATDGAIALFDGTSGNLIKDSGIVFPANPGVFLNGNGAFSAPPGGASSGDVTGQQNITPAPGAGPVQATGITLSATPNANGAGTGRGNVVVFLNGVQYPIGNGTILAPFFFGPNNATAKAADELAAGDELFFNSAILGFLLDGIDSITLDYQAQP